MRLILTLALIFLAPTAMAQTLTTAQASDFLESLNEVNAYADTLDPEVKSGALNDNVMPERGEVFSPYSGAVNFVRDGHGEVYENMKEIVGDYGFASLEQWAETGDRVVVAYMALEMEGSDMEAVTPEMLEQVPEQMRPQLERVLAMVETVRNAPEGDIEAIRPLSAELRQHMEMGSPGP